MLRIIEYRKPKASDISDKAILSAIKVTNATYDPPRKYASIWNIQNYLNMWPKKVVKAKLRSMIRRKIITGCVHSGADCRGDFEIVEK